MRGAYTAGCLNWLINNGYEFDNCYGISTGAFHLCSFLFKDKEMLYQLSTKYIADKSYIGLKSLLKTGKIVSYDTLFDYVLDRKLGYNFDGLSSIKAHAKIGLYDLQRSETVYFPIQKVTKDHLKAACSLPIIGDVVNIDGKEYLDGGVTDMISIFKSVEEGNNKHLVITTKPKEFKRKPAKSLVVKLMKKLYPQCEEMAYDYQIRHINYKDQILEIEKLVKQGNAAYIYPSENVKVSRLSGNPEKLNYLYVLGYRDMEKRRHEIEELFK